MKKFLKIVIFLLIAYIVICGSKVVLKEVNFPYKFESYVKRYSQEYDIDPLLVLSVMKAESNFNHHAQSKKDAIGLMQITKSTGTWIAEQQGIKDFDTNLLLEPEVNIRFGCWYLRNLYNEFNDWNLVIAAYNAGRGHVGKWLKNEKYSTNGKDLNYIPFPETDKYIKKVKSYYNIYKSFYKKE